MLYLEKNGIGNLLDDIAREDAVMWGDVSC